ncbi:MULTISPECIES: hypothetical protein [unclassified Pseudoalteromonas]|uniref:hypothetical protein n=1 Tax=unclassified Pseudoalteromonas TaxID=194690 RepID=UPI00041AF1F7|nr:MULTISPECIES: hypothetical protein [unclassified Pseudoalteromonas]
MIRNLSLSKNVQFYKLNKPLTKKSVDDTFKEISKDRVGNYLVNEQRNSYQTQAGNQVNYSLVSYRIDSEPSFLVGTTTLEKKYAYLLLIECNDALAILKKYVDSPESHFSNFIEEFDYDKFCHFHGDKAPEYERVTMKSMSISNAVIRSRSLEAKSLNGILSSNSSSRSIPSNFRMKIGDESYTLTPSTSRVSHRDKKSGFDGLVDWVVLTKEELEATTNQSEFLSNFAAPVCLQDIFDAGFKVVAVLIDLGEIENKVNNGGATLYKDNDSQLEAYEINQLFNQLKSPILIENDTLKVKGVLLSGKVSYTKKLITIRNKLLDSILVSEDSLEPYSLGSYINKNKPFSAVFDSPNYSYYSKSCFEDKQLLNNIPSILNIFDDNFNFNNVVSEKEKPHGNQLTRFPTTSLFRQVEDQYCANHDIVICDDMNDEWADHIAIDISDNIPSISFIHSKFTKKDSYGASAFHDVIAQALKNIGRTQAIKEQFQRKYDSEWNKNYENTNIPRVTGASNWQDLESALDTVYQNPNSIKKIVLATPFLSKTKLSSELTKLQHNRRSKPHYVQLIWLINTFISSCKELGIQAHILCKP